MTTQAFTPAEMTTALKTLKAGKAPGPDDIHPEYIIHLHERVIQWLRIFISVCLSTQTIPKMWRRAKVIGILKPNKPANEAKSYRPISILCTLYKLTERLILNRISHLVDQFLPDEQAGFREGRCTTDQVNLLTDDIEAGFERNDKCGAVFIDLSAAYDTVWHSGLARFRRPTLSLSPCRQSTADIISEAFRRQTGGGEFRVQRKQISFMCGPPT